MTPAQQDMHRAITRLETALELFSKKDHKGLASQNQGANMGTWRDKK